MVIFTFDDALNDQNFDFYQRLFRAGRNNPNGCPISATFFVSHDWTDYEMVRKMYLDGHEIASHSITHKMPQSWWSRASYAELKEELEGQRNNIQRHANIPKKDIRGIRVPFLETGGDTQFALMREEGFEYDSSFIAGPYFEGDWRLPVWPYTLEFPPGLEFCDNHNCPKGNFSGIWEFPLNRWIGLDGKACPMVDACKTHNVDTKKQASDYLWKNFKRYYGKNRAPFGVNMHATWFKDEYKLEAMDEFISSLSKMDDVYVVTLHQVVEWMRNPIKLNQAKRFSPWKTTCGKSRKLVETKKKVRDRNSNDDVGTSRHKKDREIGNTGSFKTTMKTRMRILMTRPPQRYSPNQSEREVKVDVKPIYKASSRNGVIQKLNNRKAVENHTTNKKSENEVEGKKKDSENLEEPIIITRKERQQNISGKNGKIISSKSNLMSSNSSKLIYDIGFITALIMIGFGRNFM